MASAAPKPRRRTYMASESDVHGPFGLLVVGTGGETIAAALPIPIPPGPASTYEMPPSRASSLIPATSSTTRTGSSSASVSRTSGTSSVRLPSGIVSPDVQLGNRVLEPRRLGRRAVCRLEPEQERTTNPAAPAGRRRRAGGWHLAAADRARGSRPDGRLGIAWERQTLV
jgi:hypothetical protein